MTKRTRPAAAGATEAGPIFEAVLTLQQVADNERESAGAGYLAVARRATLGVLTRTSAELQTAWATPANQEGMFAALELATEWRDHLKANADLAEAAVARLLVTGQTVANGVKP